MNDRARMPAASGRPVAPPVKVLYVAVKGRSGSTLVDSVLGEVSGFLAAGEVRFVWDVLDQGFLCGCSKPVRECELWSVVLERALGAGPDGSYLIPPSAVSTWYRDIYRWRRGRRLLRIARGRSAPWPALDRYTEVVSRLYAALADLTGARVIVDSSKWATDPVLLGLVPGVEPYCLHLVRDPRAVAHSFRRRKKWPDRQTSMPRYPSAYSALSWLVRNMLLERVRRRLPLRHYLRMRYEDFVSDPVTWLDAITGFVGERQASFPFLEGKLVRVGSNHIVSGNPDRLFTGELELREDNEWVRRMGRFDRALTTLLTLPRLGRYGYPLRASERGEHRR
ncbi:MAG TPA: sulfotransferase [Longimicrobiales bacterium]|jgi:hypothetical protein